MKRGSDLEALWSGELGAVMGDMMGMSLRLLEKVHGPGICAA